jgi:hypothetical protein
MSASFGTSWFGETSAKSVDVSTARTLARSVGVNLLAGSLFGPLYRPGLFA